MNIRRTLFIRQEVEATQCRSADEGMHKRIARGTLFRHEQGGAHLLELGKPRKHRTEGRTPVSGDHALHDSTRVNALNEHVYTDGSGLMLPRAGGWQRE